MDARELRKGNYVLLYGDVLTAVDTVFDFNNYEPIILSHEWLLKLGFVNKHVKYCHQELPPNIYIRKPYREVGHWRFVLGVNSVVYVGYVHQLQNLFFAITGEDLIIKEQD